MCKIREEDKVSVLKLDGYMRYFSYGNFNIANIKKKNKENLYNLSKMYARKYNSSYLVEQF